MKHFLALILVFTAGCDNQHNPSLPAAGQWRLINYWALWCTPCREEIPELNGIDNAPDITVFGVNYDDKKGQELSKQRSALGITFANLPLDPASVLGISRPNVLPTTLIISPQGELVATLKGPQTASSLEQTLLELGREKAHQTGKKTPAISRRKKEPLKSGASLHGRQEACRMFPLRHPLVAPSLQL